MTDESQSVPSAEENQPLLPKLRSRTRKLLLLVIGLLLLWSITAYLVMPLLWDRYMSRHPALADVPKVTHTKSGIPGDPINVALVGTEDELKKIMQAAKWHLADPLSLINDLKIAEDSVLRRSYDDAPVSSLYLWGRKEDLAFEQPVGNSPRQRHHVRFWRSEKTDSDGRPIWAGSAIFDDRVGLSRTTGQITHHTAPDIDTERAKLFADLLQTGQLTETFFMDGFHTTLQGKNGGGDPWFTDGKLEVGVIAR
jgi:LssY C-terminus